MAAWIVAPFVALLFVGGARAASPIDGVYRVSEGAVSGQGGSAGACWPTPMRSALSPDTPAGEPAIYDVQIVVNGNQAVFTKPGGGGTLLTEPLTTVPATTPGGLPSYTVAITQQPVNPSDIWMVDGRFLPTGPGAVSVDITWTYQDSPSHTGQCQTEMGGQLSTPVSGGGGVPVDITTVVVGGVVIVTAITIGGWRWRNRKNKPLSDPGQRLAGKVPARCNDIATRHDNELEILTSMAEAERELAQKLDRAETIHKNNIIKARMVFNIEIVQTVGGFVTDFALALRPSVLRQVGPSILGEQDTWRPPSSISAELTERIRQAEDMVRNLWGRFQILGNEVETLKGQVGAAVESLPTVVEAKQVWEIQMNRLSEMMSDLPKANALRTELAELEPKIKNALAATDTAEGAWRSAQRELSDAQTNLNLARNKLPDKYWTAASDLKNADKQLTDVLRTATDPESTLVSSARGQVNDARAALSKVEQTVPRQMNDIADLQKVVDAKQAVVDSAWDAQQAAGRIYDDLSNQREKASMTLSSQYSDLTAADIERQGRIAGQAERGIQQAEEQGRQQVGRDLMEREAERERTASEARAAEELVLDLRRKAEHDASWNVQVGNALGTGIKFVLKPITYPVGLVMETWDWAFGSAQTPQEMVDILVRGQTNIRILRDYLTEIDKRIFSQSQLVDRLRTQVDACVQGVTLPAGTPPPGPVKAPVAAPAGVQ